MEMGSKMVVQTVEAIIEKHVDTRVQKSFIQGSEVLKPAPKITKELCHIDFRCKTRHVYNLIRGLSPYPGAYTELVKDDKIQQLKIYSAERIEGERFTAMLSEAGISSASAGDIISDGRTFFAIATSDGAVSVKELQISGKRKMAVKDFLLGFRDIQNCKTTEGTSSKITGHHA